MNAREDVQRQSTKTAPKSYNPKWNKLVYFPLASLVGSNVTVHLYDRQAQNAGKGVLVGTVKIPLSGLTEQTPSIGGWYDLKDTYWQLNIHLKRSPI
eukprot:CAMPEP_0117891694 /NCGR_PEP_ID=MMETSP0950-20121206/24124_1 /TAXON_ID=44440 /ORGANISM="Chattonella subsalsa, Strain CCMP2191" /LENGTH=96 /DNA_ID=CAMNT_0005751293 /DNA_START=221 /DNA_END=511 /DNA_ORIENTATION=+